LLKNRGLIGVIISEAEGFYQQRLLKGIISRCFSLNYDVAIFTTFRDRGLPEYVIGEKNIYNLINFDHFDGILVAPLMMGIPNLIHDLGYMLMKNCKCPVLYIDHPDAGFPGIYTNDSVSIEKIVDHLIEHHGYTDIYCLAGDPGTGSTVSRVKGYKDSLLKHGIPVDESRISYEGDFWYTGGERLAGKILRGEIAKPQAVVCISDYMAIGLVNELMKNGVQVPEDIAVTGFDAAEEAASCFPSITTCLPPVFQTGVDAVSRLVQKITGVMPEPCGKTEGTLEIGLSCGCRDIDVSQRTVIRSLKKKIDDFRDMMDSYMSEALTTATGFEDSLVKFYHYLYLIEGYSDYYMCLCENWDGSADNYSAEPPGCLVEGYTDKMHMVLAAEGTEYVHSDYLFDTKDMLPDIWRKREKPKAYYFTPLHFNERCLGYSVLTYGDRVDVFDTTYRFWSRNVMNALEYNRVHKKLYRASFRDVLTGVYNRSGIEQKVSMMLKESNGDDKRLMVCMADLDGLKEINDNYGHLEGDNALTIVAGAIQSCCRSSEVCARIGGDEFVVVGYDDYDDGHAMEFIENVMKYIEGYNKTSNKPYKISLSIGGTLNLYDRDVRMDDLIDKADRLMYIEKLRKKTG